MTDGANQNKCTENHECTENHKCTENFQVSGKETCKDAPELVLDKSTDRQGQWCPQIDYALISKLVGAIA